MPISALEQSIIDMGRLEEFVRNSVAEASPNVPTDAAVDVLRLKNTPAVSLFLMFLAFNFRRYYVWNSFQHSSLRKMVVGSREGFE